MPRVSDRVIEQVRERADIVDVVSRSVNLSKQGSNFVGLCPFHNEKTPSFTVSRTKGIFHCFGCGAGGDSITFLMKLKNIGFIEAVTELAEMYGIALDDDYKYEPGKNKRLKELFEINKMAAKYFFEQLRNSDMARRYLATRGISERTARIYGLGYAPNIWDGLLNHLKSSGIDLNDAMLIKLISKSEKSDGFDFFRNRLMFPIIDQRRRVVGFGGRVFDDSLPKYLNSPDTCLYNKRNNLYGLNIIASNTTRDKIILVEGYMDVIGLYERGIDYAVACLGTALTEHQAKLIKQYGKEVYVCLDGDAAGIRAATRTISIFRGVGVKPKFMRLESGMDPDEYVSKFGKGGFENEMERALDDVDFQVGNILKEKSQDEVNEALDKIKKTAEVLGQIESAAERELYVKKYGKYLNISEKSLMSEIDMIVGKKPIYRVFSDKRSRTAGHRISTHEDMVRRVLSIALVDGNARDEVLKSLSAENLKDRSDKNILENLEKFQEYPDKASFLEDLYKGEEIDLDSMDFYMKSDKSDSQGMGVVKELIFRIKEESIISGRNDLLVQLRSLSADEKEQARALEIANKISLLSDELEDLKKDWGN